MQVHKTQILATISLIGLEYDYRWHDSQSKVQVGQTVSDLGS